MSPDSHMKVYMYVTSFVFYVTWELTSIESTSLNKSRITIDSKGFEIFSPFRKGVVYFEKQMCTSHAVPWLKSSFAAFWHFSNGNERRKSTRKKRKIQFFFFILREKKYETLKKMIQPADCWSKSLTWKRRGAFIVMCPRWVLDMVRPWILTLSISKSVFLTSNKCSYYAKWVA